MQKVPIPKVEVHHADIDHIYLNITLYNDSARYIIANFTQTLNQAFLDDSDQFNCSIIRLSIDANTIPRVVQDVSTAPPAEQWWVGVSYLGVYYDTQVILPLVPNFLGVPSRETNNIQAFLDVINAAFLTSQTAAVGAGFVAPYGQSFISYEPSTGLYQLNVPSYYGTGTVGAGIFAGVHMSFDLYYKFDGFRVVQEFPLTANNHQITFVREWSGNNALRPSNFFFGGLVPPDGDYMIFKQDVAHASSVESLTRIVITSSKIPAKFEARSVQRQTSNQGGQNNQVLQILTDLYSGNDSEITSKAFGYNYLPYFLRLSSLQNHGEMNSWDIGVFWADLQGRLTQMYVRPGGTFDCKILFLRKGLSV